MISSHVFSACISLSVISNVSVSQCIPYSISQFIWIKFGTFVVNLGLLGTAVCQVHACQIKFQEMLHFNIYTFRLFLAFTGGVPWVHFWLPPQKWG